MLVSGRGSVANLHYTGDEAAGEIKKLIDAVIEHEDEFEKWEALVNRAMNLEGGVTRNSNPSAIELVRNVYDLFLGKFPLFYGYWKKYADFEFSIGGTETAEMVYERGVSSIPSCVQLWTHYCSFKLDTSHDNDVLRALFERGAEFVGIDYQSYIFWDTFIEFEERINEPANITVLQRRAFQLTTSHSQKYYEKFRLHIAVRPLEELGDADLLEKCQAAVLATAGSDRPAMEVDRMVRAKLDEHYYAIFNVVSQAVTARWSFEQNIKRPYFHVTDLEEAELDNWRKYLDFEEKEGDAQRIMFLYERCLVACALYEEFWLRYARWLFSQGREEDCRLVYMRASCIFVPISQPTIRLNWARFEEKIGRVQIAHDIHESILDQLPGHVETIISLAGVDRRNEGNDAAVETLEQHIKNNNSEVGGILATEQARILWQCKGSVDEARALFKAKQDQFLDSKQFWIKYLEFEAAQPVVEQEEAHARVKEIHELVRTKGRFSAEASKQLSQYYMQYLLNRGGKQAAEEYMLLDQEINGGYSPSVDVIMASPTAPADEQKVQ